MSLPDCLLVLALWGFWLLYWAASARGNKPVARRESSTSRALQTLPISVGGLLVLVPELGLPLADRHFTAPAPLAGLALTAAGLLFTVWARHCLGGNWSAEVSLRQGHQLVRSGPYRLVRHPIYTGGLLAVAGSVMAGAQWRGLLGFALVFGTLAYKLRLEEAWLAGLFGDDYRRYQDEVPALFPLIH